MARIYGGAEVAGRCLAEYEHQSAVLRGSDEALTAPTVSRERRDRRKKKLAKEEAEQVETREAQAAQATTRAASHVHNDEDEASESVNTACAVPIEDQQDDRDQQDVIGESTTDRTEDEVARRQEGREQTGSGAETTRAGVDEQVELPAAVAVAVTVEREQFELPDDDKGVGENAERIILAQQPAELAWRRMLDEAVEAVKSREEVGMSALEVAHHYFCFFSNEAGSEAVRRGAAGGGEATQVAGEGGCAAGGAARQRRRGW